MSNNLKMLITAGLDTENSIKTINSNLKALAKHPALQKLLIEIKMNDSYTRSANHFLNVIKSMNEAIAEGTVELNRQIKSVQSLKKSIEDLPAAGSKASSSTKTDSSSLKSLADQAGKDIEGGFRGTADSIVKNEDIIQSLSLKVAQAGLRFESLSWFTNLYTGSAASARLATIALQGAMSMGLSLAISGVTWALSAMVEAIAKSRRESAEAVKINYSQIESLREQKQSIIELKTEMESLLQMDDRGDLNTEGKQRLLDIQTQLVEQYGVAANKIDAEGRAYSDSISSINERTAALEKQIQMEEQLNRSKLIAKDSKNTKEIKNAQEDVSEYTERVGNTKKQIEKLEEDIKSGKVSSDQLMYTGEIVSEYGNLSRSDKFWDQKLLSEHSYTPQKLLEAYNQELAELKVKLDESTTQLNTSLFDRKETLNASTNNYVNSLIENGTQISDTQRSFIQEIVNSISGNGSTVMEQEDQLEEIINGMVSGNLEELITSYHDLVNQFDQNPSTTDNTKIQAIRLQVEELIESVTNGKTVSNDFMGKILAQFPDVDQKAFSMQDAIEDIQSSYEKAAEKISIYNHLLNENSSEKGLNAEKVAKLIKEDQSLIDLFYVENGIIKLNTDLAEKQRTEQIQALKDLTRARKDDLIAANQVLTQKLLAYGIELNAIDSLEDAIEAREKLDDTNIGLEGTDPGSIWLYKINQFNKKEGQELIDSFIELFKNSAILEESLKTVGKSLEEDLGSSAESVSEQLSELQKKLLAVDDAINRNAHKRERYAKSSQKYRDSLLEENRLLEQKKKLIEQDTKNNSNSTYIPDQVHAVNNGTASVSNSGVSAMLNEAVGLQGKFAYAKVSGEYKGTYEQFVNGAISDCSQFVQEMFKEFLNIKLPRTSAQQAKVGQSIDKKDLQPGDLVFFNDGSGKKNVSHVGISMGNNKFIQMGTNNGLKEADLTSNYWSSRYLSAKRIVGAVSPNYKGSSGKTGSNDNNYKDKSQEWLATDNQIYLNNLDTINSNNATFDKKIRTQDGLLEKSKATQMKFTEDSDKYRFEESKQIDILLNKRELLSAKADAIEASMKEFNIESDDLDAMLFELGQSADEITQEIQSKRIKLVNSDLEKFSNKILDGEYQLQLSRNKMLEYSEGSSEYSKELYNQVALTKDQIAVNKEAIAYISQQLEDEQLSVKVKADLQDKLEQLTLDNYEYSQSIRDINESYADSVISNYKKMLEKKRELELAEIEKSKQLEDERHKESMKNLDDELELFEKVINAQLKQMDREFSSVDYDKDLNKKLKERQDIVNQINTLALDDSYEAKAKRKSLDEQLINKDEEISNFRQDRERELRKENLSDQLEDKKEQIGVQKDLEDEYHNGLIDKWEKEKEEKEQLYKGMLEDEKVFYQMKQDLLSNDAIIVASRINEIKGEYGVFFQFLQDQMLNVGTSAEILGTRLLENLEFEYQQDSLKLDQSPALNAGTTGASAQSAWKSYLENKDEAEKIRKKMSTMDNKNSAEYKQMEKSFKKLQAENDAYRKTYHFPDGSFDELQKMKPFSAESGGMTPAYTEGKFLLAHEKELILNKTDTANLLTAVDVTRSIFKGIKNITSSFMNISAPAAAVPGGDVNMYITIDKLQGNEEGANTFFSIIQKNFKKSGI
ncbi:NlpC/P60 family protein [Fontibacillus panacisegetis]|uniref:NlpC/P60 family protein n=1 Tax=Fontibacillus panacisegetis TaxID=670482 RepID=A0A1G7G391_9BACL|nr:NlpC/P60 family protein [Fontibacillus panacisegetis]SDE82573.1 NlpC/P60 family protein [Fontibacillus panacisegetis]